jgi:hypothetical protein
MKQKSRSPKTKEKEHKGYKIKWNVKMKWKRTA